VLPYLARVLGPRELGVVMIVQSFSFVLGLILEYGFGLSASRDVARARGDRAALTDIVAGVQGAKLALAGVAVLVALAIWPAVAIFRADGTLLLFGIALTLAQSMVPIWFFVGVERLRPLALIELVTRGLSVVLILVLVRHAGQGKLVLVIYLLGAALGTMIVTALMYRDVAFTLPRWRDVAGTLRSGATIFVGTAAVSLYTSANVFMLGLLVPTAQVAFYAGAERVVRASMRVISPVAGATYPRINALLRDGRPDRANRLGLMTVAGLGAVSLLLALVYIALAPLAVHVLYGPSFDATIPVLRAMALVLPLGVMAATLSGQFLLTRNLDREVTNVVIITGIVNVVAIFALVPGLGIRAAAWVLVGVESLTLLGTLYYMRRARVFARAGAGAI